MALNTVTDAVWVSAGRFGHPGPFRHSNGDLYIVAEDNNTADDVSVFRSTNGGSTWTRQDTANQPNITNGFEVLAAILDGTTLHIATVSSQYTSGMTDPIDIEYHTFSVSSNTWGTTNESIESPDMNAASITFFADIAVRSDGDVIVIHPEAHTEMGSDYSAIGLSRRESGSWTNVGGIQTTTANQYGRMVMAPNDECHIGYQLDSSSERARTLDSANNLSTIVSPTVAPQGRPITWDNGGTQQILFHGVGTVQRMSEDASGDIQVDLSATTPADATAGSGGNTAVAWDSGNNDAYILWRRNSDDDLMYDKSSHAATAGWGTDVEQEDAVTVNGVWANFYNSTIGYVVLDGTTVKYGELSVGSGAQNVTGSAAFAPSLTFAAGKVNQWIQAGAAFTPTLSFPQGDVVKIVRSTATFAPSLTFGTGSVDLTVKGVAAFTPSLTWPTGDAINRQLVTGAAAFAPSLTFAAGKVNQWVQATAAFTPSLTWPTGAVRPVQTVTGAAAFQPSLSFAAGKVNLTVRGGAAFQPSLTWPTGNAANRQIVSDTTAFAPSLTWPTGDVVKIVRSTATFAPSITFPAGKANFTVKGSTFAPSLTWPTGDVVKIVRGAAAFTPSLTYPTGTVSQAGGGQNVTGSAAFQPSLTWPTGVIDLIVRGSTFAPSLTWPTGFLNQAQTVTGSAAFIPSLTFETGDVVKILRSGTTFTPTLTWPAGTVGFTVVGTTFTPTLNFPTGTLQAAESGTRQGSGLAVSVQGSGLGASRQGSGLSASGVNE